METKNPILSLSLHELNSLKIAISKKFLVKQISGNIVEDYRTRWQDIYDELMGFVLKYFRKIVKEFEFDIDKQQGITYGKLAEILIDKRIEHLKSIEAKELPKKEPDVDNENKWIACKKEHDVFVSKDIMFTYKELENAIDMARSLPKLDIDTIIACQTYLKTKL